MTKTLHDDVERDLRELFDRQHRAITPSNRVWDETEPVVVADLEVRHAGPRRRVAVTAAALVASAAIATAVIAAGRNDAAVKTQPRDSGTASSVTPSSDTPSTTPTSDVTPNTVGSGGVQWDTPQVQLDGGGFSIYISGNAGTKEFTTTGSNVSVHSDPGDARYQTLELEWSELGVPQRWYIYFASDGKDWWATEMRTYDGSLAGEWVYFNDEAFRTPVGSAWSGNLDLTASDHGVTSHLRMQIDHLQAFVNAAATSTT